MDNTGHNLGDHLSNGAHIHGATPAPYHQLSSRHSLYNNTPPLVGQTGHHFVYGQTVETFTPLHKRQVRATQACNSCRSRKQKCDEEQPCHFCRKYGQKCEYKEVPLFRQDRTLQDIETKVNALLEKVTSIPDCLDRIEQQVQGQNGKNKRTTPSDEPLTAMSATTEESNGSAYESARERTLSKLPTTAAKAQSGATQFQASNVSGAVKPVQKQVPEVFEAETRLPAEHTTAAHITLMNWPAMQQFFKGIVRSGTNYPREQEERRGVFELYGRGEDADFSDGVNDGVRATEDVEGDLASFPTLSSGGENWDIRFTAAATGASNDQSDPQHILGRSKPHGALELHFSTVRRLFQSYLSHMHPLQPFLDKDILASMVEQFIQRYSPDLEKDVTTSPSTALESDLTLNLKRKRSDNRTLSEQESRAPLCRASHIERTIGNAIVLLVLAIGRICEHKMRLPASSRNPATGACGSLKTPTTNSPPAAIREEMAALDVDITPDLAYYTYAVEILGTVYGGNSLSHGQAGVLACLYMGQLARVMESWGWICYACRESLLPVTLESDVSESMNLQEVVLRIPGGAGKHKVNLIKFLYWTCMQLESDIMAEMSHLRPSGISENEECIGIPIHLYTETPLGPSEEANWLCFSAHIQLRKILNRVRLSLYTKRSTLIDVLARKDEFWDALWVDLLEEQLQGWRKTLPAWLQWNDWDEPSNDINKARMRAEYYGARYIITRPALYWAIHREQPPTFLMEHYGFTPINEKASPNPPANSSFDRSLELRFRAAITTSQRCIESAVKNTIAFDGIENADQRLIVTNIFGTAHTQFGNCLVLAAVRKSWIHDLIQHQDVVSLVERTIKFLYNSVPTCWISRVFILLLQHQIA
ncbi:hypothetical protein B0J12DRAFT_582517 [Macrophomina phaseolina]|uniref:Zn(2)-C6 fungal-type domain-containing protein n=1 Tax=Macrophomina phaseolina TaxID=35725 RepID=A0ABQ8FXK1_9PEZI|nr:hypothetical protein B0J12DRAFT_582517 [Macrophomina phaseolina]